jgi:rubredoxin
MEEIDLKTYMCVICGFIYDESRGLPEEGIAAGTQLQDIPLNWECPDCGARKDDFEMVEI